ncbi:MAG TPA: 2,3-butanediol dehydrogenase [Intrasporangium sp.]|uniref:2,3-butanediol dehydrogenase n=1 Tax=Intrasporangium sp. TaxID=1925024 RepID=UPI002D786ABA|nr:2,3-butanediol dehydrogenase [Intrasporangium sp.]HET7399186.1 2,3-butanediol dehydrogenase [Intrasporangium sp.]
MRIDWVPEPEPGPGTVKIAVEWCGICGTDLHEYFDGPIFCPAPGKSHPLTGASLPVVLGHEFVGTVHSVGEGVRRIRLGDRVVVEPRRSCGQCAACTSGRYNCCPRAATIGLQGGGGGLAQYIVVDEDLVFQIGDLSAEVGALIEPLAVAHHAIGQGPRPQGATAVVFGGGPIGLLVVWMLKAMGASTVCLVEPSEARRSRAGRLGADHALDPTAYPSTERMLEYAGLSDVDVAFECAGVEAALQGCLIAVRPGGTVVNVAISGRPLSLDLTPLLLKEIHLVGTICYANDHQPVIDLLRRYALPVETLVTKRIGLDQLVTAGFRALASGDENHVKILVSPTMTQPESE